MSKELEALENIKHYDTRVGLHEDDYKLIETALKKLEQAENCVFTSKEDVKTLLKALEILKTFGFKIEDYTERVNGSVSVTFTRIILDDDEIDLLKEVLL